MDHELRVLLDAIPAPIFYKDAEGIYRGCNKAFLAYLGKTLDQVVGQDVYGLSPRELADVFKAADDALFASRTTQIYEARVRYADGTYHDVMFHKATFDDEHGALAGMIGTILDITTRKQAEYALAESEARYRAVVAVLGEGIVLVAKDARVVAVNPAARAILGVDLLASGEWPFLRDDGEPMPFEASPVHQTLVTGVEHTAVVVRLATRAWVALSTRVIADSGDIVVSFADITERRMFQEQLEHQAFHDALTGLPNRKLFMQRLEHALEVARRRGENVAVAFVDLDGFKRINDTRGHEAGDHLLAAIARRLGDAVRGSDMVARIGGDEFCAILTGVADVTAARSIAMRLMEAIRPASEGVTASIGLALFPDHATEPGVLLRQADAAMYRVKLTGKNAVGVFT